jgi:hypothetical protein
MTRYYFRPIKPETVINVLHYLRVVAVREGRDTTHVDALLREQGVDPTTLPIPQKTPKTFKRGELQRLVMAALPGTGPEIARRVSERSGLLYKVAYKRTYIALHRLKQRGRVNHSDRVWFSPSSAQSR